MRIAPVPLAIASVVLVAGCSTEGSGPVTSVDAVTEAPTEAPEIPDPLPGTVGPTRVAVAYADAMRTRDAGALYDIGSDIVQRGETRAEYVARLDLSSVTNARLSGSVEVGWSEQGERFAIAPVIVTADGMPQPGRIIIVKEEGEWRYLDAVQVGAEPTILDTKPPTSRR